MSSVDFLSGFAMATFAASGIFFLKFWRASRDRFYLLFCTASWLIAFERIILFWVRDPSTPPDISCESNSWIYLIRLAAFILILIAILDKNRSASTNM